MFYRIIIPDERNEEGINPAEIFRDYLKALHDDLKPVAQLTPSSPLFYRGNPPKDGTKSTFVNQPIGEPTLKLVPGYIAELLGKENPHLFTSNSFKWTTLTIGAANGASIRQLTVSKISLFIYLFCFLLKKKIL